jgi:hypothetical protein
MSRTSGSLLAIRAVGAFGGGNLCRADETRHDPYIRHSVRVTTPV